MGRNGRPSLKQVSRQAHAAQAKESLLAACPLRLPIQPDIFHSPAVVDAVHLQFETIDIWRPACRFPHVVEDRASDVFLNAPVDFPHEFVPLRRVSLHRLLIDHAIDLVAAIPGVIPFGVTDVVLIEILVRIIQSAADRSQGDNKIRAHEPG